MYNEGISREGDLVDTGLLYEVVKKSGNSFLFGEEKLGVGREAARNFLKEHADIAAKIEDEITEKAKDGQGE